MGQQVLDGEVIDADADDNEEVRTEAEVRAFFEHPPQSLLIAADAVILAAAHYAKIAPVVETYQRKILKKHQWRIDPAYADEGAERRVITDPRQAYLLSNHEHTLFLIECADEREKAGLSVPGPHFCPRLAAENKLRLAKQYFCEELKPVTGVSYRQLIHTGMDFNHYIDLSIKLLAPHLKTASSAQIMDESPVAQHVRPRPRG